MAEMSQVLDVALADDIISRLMRAVCVWRLGHKDAPCRMKLPKAEYDELMEYAIERGFEGTPLKFRGMEIVRNTRNFIEFDVLKGIDNG